MPKKNCRKKIGHVQNTCTGHLCDKCRKKQINRVYCHICGALKQFPVCRYCGKGKSAPKGNFEGRRGDNDISEDGTVAASISSSCDSWICQGCKYSTVEGVCCCRLNNTICHESEIGEPCLGAGPCSCPPGACSCEGPKPRRRVKRRKLKAPRCTQYCYASRFVTGFYRTSTPRFRQQAAAVTKNSCADLTDRDGKSEFYDETETEDDTESDDDDSSEEPAPVVCSK